MTFCDKICAVKTHCHGIVSLLCVINVAVAREHIKQLVALIAQIICVLDAAALDFHDFFIQFINSVSDGINIFDSIFDLSVQIVLIFLKGFVDSRCILHEACRL